MGNRQTAVRDARRLLGSRPGRMRGIAILTVAAILAAGVLGFIVASQVISNTNRIDESTGPLLIGTQKMFASMAEADAAATAVYLSGSQGDREQRALYERALDRAGNSLEQVAQLAGDDEESHEAVARIAESLTEYAGLIESSRVLNQLSLDENPDVSADMALLGIPTADDQLLQAIQLVRGDIARDVDTVTQRAQQRLDDEIGGGLFYPAVGVYLLAVLVLVLAMLYLARRFRRILNLPLFLAALLTVGVAAWFGYSYFNQQASLENARDGGYDSIQLTSEIQARAFQYKADESLGLISGNFMAEKAVRDGLATEIMGTASGLIFEVESTADSSRERAAAGELAVRWDRYRQTGLVIEGAMLSDQPEEALRIASGRGNDAFTGFNTAVESVLSDNQAQFDAEVKRAGDSLGYLRWVVVIGAVLAALLAWAGFALRIREYQ